MDYTQSSLRFRVRKALRYTRLYGPRRTYYKIRAQYHMRKAYDMFPERSLPLPEGGHVGMIGCGNFAFSTIAYYLKKNFGAVIRGCMDIEKARARSLCEFYKGRYYTDDASEIFSDPEIDLVFIASNHASHAEYAIEALAAGKHVHIEKPHAVSMDQLTRLCEAARIATGKINLGFNRPFSPMGKLITQFLSNESGPGMYNWFIAGHAIDPDHWYFRPSEGGRVLGNLCHWTDFVYRLVPEEQRYPVLISPTTWKKSDFDIVVNYVFGDGSIATLSFSAKGHTFEGVRERFSAHRNDVLISLDDFHLLTINKNEYMRTISPLFRNHGHEQSVCNSYLITEGVANAFSGCSVDYVMGTGMLFLATKDALEQNRVITLPALWELDPSGGRFGASPRSSEMRWTASGSEKSPSGASIRGASQ